MVATNTALLTGWADEADTTEPVTVVAYINGKPVGNGVAAQPRPDVAARHSQSANAGYAFTITHASVTSGATVCVSAANRGKGANVVLGCTTIKPATTTASVPTTTAPVPTTSAPKPVTVVDIAAGGFHTVALLSDGTVKTWGNNFNGELGDGTLNESSYPVTVMADATTPLTDITAISAGLYHTAALTKDGTVKTWGYNAYGQLGNGTDYDSTYPATVMADATTPLSGIIDIAAGRSHTAALASDGTVKSWGSNAVGQLGDGSVNDSWYPVSVMDDVTTPLTGITAIAAGGGHIAALSSDGTVKAWGDNFMGQLGNGTITNSNYPVTVLADVGTPLTDITDIGAGIHHTVALTTDGTVNAWGYNNHGQLGDGTTTNSSYPVSVMTDATTPLTGIKKIAAGYFHTAIVAADGTVRTWGYNASGQLGNGTTTKSSYPVTVDLGL